MEQIVVVFTLLILHAVVFFSSSSGDNLVLKPDAEEASCPVSTVTNKNYPRDPHGYHILCLCMGRYGNQMEQLLGVLSNAKAMNRTLVLPPFVSYRWIGGVHKVEFIPIEDVFRVDEIRRFYPKVIPMEEFMTSIAPKHWPELERIIYCHSRMQDSGGCSPKVANFGQFWDHYGVDFVQENYVNDLSVLNGTIHPVIATKGAYAPFPVRERDRYIARYFFWGDKVEQKVKDFMLNVGVTDDDVLVATHLRAGVDWVSACNHGIGKASFMASPQCADEINKAGGLITEDICLPTANMTLVASTLQHASEKTGLRRTSSKRPVLFVGSDVKDIGDELMAKYGLENVFEKLIQNTQAEESSDGLMNAFVDLAVMTKADYFIGNCVSSFTSFVTRMRNEQGTGLGTEFYGLSS